MNSLSDHIISYADRWSKPYDVQIFLHHATDLFLIPFSRFASVEDHNALLLRVPNLHCGHVYIWHEGMAFSCEVAHLLALKSRFPRLASLLGNINHTDLL